MEHRARARAHTHTQAGGSLQDDSAAEQEIIQRVMSRFFRDGGAGSHAGRSEVEDESHAVQHSAGATPRSTAMVVRALE